jgi:predicted dehydrogenase
MKKVAIIGDSQHGGYGHGLDKAFAGVSGTRTVAVADPDEAGRKEAIDNSGAEKGYSEYRRMLAEEKPDIVVVATHDLGNHPEFIHASVEAGAHVYVEKPLATTPAEIDGMLHACKNANKSLVVAIPWRGHRPIEEHVVPIVKGGRIGEPRYARMYGFGGELAGDQWFIDLYPHFFDLLTRLFGLPSWCHAHIVQDGRDATAADVKEGAFGLGPTVGNGMRAYYQYNCGFAAEYQSFADDGKEAPYRMDIFGTAGAISIPGAMSDGPDVYLHPLSNPKPVADDRWEVVVEEPYKGGDKWVNAHHRMAKSMVDMLEGREPEIELCKGGDQRDYAMMSMAARQSHIEGTRIELPFEFDGNPLLNWK